MADRKNQRKRYRSVSHNFKLAVMALLFGLILVRLAVIVYFPDEEIISDRISLFIILFIASYLWIQELKDYYNLSALHENLEAAHEQLKEAEIDTIASLIKTEEEKDVNTRGHSERVTKIALAIADEMGLESESRKTLSRAGILHDIGKIGINDAILHKIEKLTEADWDVIKSHPQKAIDILEPLKFLALERSMILDHHERYDGTGLGQQLGRGTTHPRERVLFRSGRHGRSGGSRHRRTLLSRDGVQHAAYVCQEGRSVSSVGD